MPVPIQRWASAAAILVALPLSWSGAVAEPGPELASLTQSYERKVKEILAPLRESFLGQLDSLEKRLADGRDIEGALKVREIRVGLALENPIALPLELPEDPRELRRLGTIYSRTAESRARPWRAKYIDALRALEARLVRNRELEAAAEVQRTLAELEGVGEPEPEPGPEGPPKDLALASRGAEARAPVGAEFLIDGETAIVLNDGVAYGRCPTSFEVELARRYKLNEIRFLLWSGDAREYRYKLDISADGKSWETVADRSRKPSKDWQVHEFKEPTPVRVIRIQGLENTANDYFHIVEVEAR